jgi:hypothetical protein
MDTVVVLLGTVVVVLVIFLIYNKYYSGVSTLMKQTSLLTKPPDIVATSIQKGDSVRYAYGIWVYVNQWDTKSANKVIFARDKEIIVYLDSNANLVCIINPDTLGTYTKLVSGIAPTMADGADTSKTQKTITVSNNFPLQKWVYITVSVDNKIADIYLEGKLVKSIPIPRSSPDASRPIVFGGGYNAYISQFQRWTTELDPQTVWSTYMKSSGGNSLTGAVGNYNVNLSLLKDNVVSSNFSLF